MATVRWRTCRTVFVARRAATGDSPAPFTALSDAVAACSDEPVSGSPADIGSGGHHLHLRQHRRTARRDADAPELRRQRPLHRQLPVARRPADRVMCVLPFYYVYGLSLLHTHLAVGGSLVIENRSAFPNVVLDAMHEHQVTGFAGVPSTFALMLHRSNLDTAALPSLRYVTQAGGGMPPARISEWLAARSAGGLLRDVRRHRSLGAPHLPATHAPARQAGLDRPRDSRRRDPGDPRGRHRGAAGRGRGARGARGPTSHPGTGTTRRRRRIVSGPSAIGPETLATRTRTATSTSSAVSTT